MLWRSSISLLFLFYHTSNAQIVLVPLKEQLENKTVHEKLLLKGVINNEGSIKTLKAKRPDNPLPAQWAQGGTESNRWPHGDILYYIDDETYGEDVATHLNMASKLLAIEGEFGSCPRFKQIHRKPSESAPTGSHWLHFTNPNRVRSCTHSSGAENNGEVKIVLGYDCLKPHQVLHAILHGLGFRDEVAHPKRDLFVRVMWENIQPAFRSMYRIQPVDENGAGLMDYDPQSIMHFHDRAYSLNGQATLTSMLPGLKIEPSTQLSRLDKLKIQRMFGHECRERYLHTIMEDRCGLQSGVNYKNNNNNTNGCPPSGGGNQIVVPGNDVSVGAVAGDNVVVQGNDDDVDRDAAGDDVGGNVVAPANDVVRDEVENGKVENSTKQKLSHMAVDDTEVKANDDFKKPIKIKAGFDMPSGELLVSGYVEEKYKLRNKKLEKKKLNIDEVKKPVKIKTGFDMPSGELIVTGYVEESKKLQNKNSKLPGLKIEPSVQLSRLDKLKIQRMFSHECRKRYLHSIMENRCGLQSGVNYKNNNYSTNRCFLSNGGGNKIVVPGNNVNTGGSDDGVADNNDQHGPGNDNIVVPGNDVNLDGVEVADNEVVPSNDENNPTNKLSQKLLNSNENNPKTIPDEEAIIVGY